ncbi:MAG: GAF domain-containing protein [Candidatus Eiseniibacteriota bacterium]
MAAIDLAELMPCFQGIVPSIIATCGADGEPNVTYLSHVDYIDQRHVALSCQFFNKTRRNIAGNPRAQVIVHHPVTFETYRLDLRHDHSETEGALFEAMAMRIQVIASHTGMAGVFRLRSADVYEVLGVERVDGFLEPADPAAEAAAPPLPSGPLSELRGVQLVAERVARAHDLDALLAQTLLALDELLGFSHAMLFVPVEPGSAGPCGRLTLLASRGYGETGIGAEILVGQGAIGTAAEHRHLVRVSGVGAELRYGRAIRGRVEECGESASLTPEIPLPGLPDAQAQLALPLVAGDELVGVLALESRDPLCFDEWDASFLQLIGYQIAMGMRRMERRSAARDAAGAETGDGNGAVTADGGRAAGDALSDGPGRHQLVYYRNDDCIFADGEYLIRHVPAKILWKLLGQHEREGRTEFTNRELRLDPSLGLPVIKDNLESRLILLRRRLEARCAHLRLVPVARGRFRLEVEGVLELIERESA